ncbi:Metallo-hydrolase/oxidoreductase [Dacryopinax primogenitus]|uniref:Metallo-hydrolase/oxidoreductase n=1 Tax=Dacryopinax primogenitus (strain DJM 731) TaxID=1858805 RepID=M5FRS2_DACPD|nr:Metallo-hydrolase/oxidoreductase [Dacryopinax primogenitus]EJT97724.1 Metallo-hydrolase/oxidoreductase [Dacryopinax primogenitus]
MADIEHQHTEYDFAPLPEGQTTCTIQPLVNCTLTIPEPFVLTPASSPTARYQAPTFVFLITHESGKKYLFDLGVRFDWEQVWPEGMLAITRDPWDPKIVADVGEMLAQGGVDPKTVDGIIFSHHHWDHTGLISPFPNAALLGGKVTFLEGASGDFKDSTGRAVDLAAQIAKEGRTPQPVDFDAEGAKHVGAFEKCVDLLGDGSLWICQTPGHTPGHVSALVRVTPSPDASYVLLGGDTTHHPSLICPCHHHLRINTTFKRPSDPPTRGPRVMHGDIPRAWDTMQRTARMEREGNVMVVVAHDYLHWRAWKDDKRVMFPGEGIGKWKETGLKIKREYKPDGYEYK